jgi:hypothetical protein
MVPMTVTVDLPEAALRRIETEAERRGVGLADVITDLAAQLPAEPAPRRVKRRLAFVGVGASAHGVSDHIEERLADGFGRD